MAEHQNEAAKAEAAKAEAAKAEAAKAEAAKAEAAKAEAAKAEAAKRHTGRPAYAIHRINGTIEPSTLFRPTNADERGELEALGAIRDLTDAEESLFAKTGEGAVVGDDEAGLLG